MPPGAIEEEKSELRARMRRLRGSLPPAERSRLATMVEEALFTLHEVRAAGSVLLFYAFGSEVPTAGMAERLLQGGARLLLPYLEEADMEAAEVRPGDPMASTTYGPREPARRVAIDPQTVDLVITPGLAFDRHGHRLGYGGGHYDRYFARLGPAALRVGVGFSVQVLDEVPTEPTDRPVDVVVTDAGVHDARPEGGAVTDR
jgi:5-formyltetrahydrofolate cyclo-ligase